MYHEKIKKGGGGAVEENDAEECVKESFKFLQFSHTQANKCTP